MSMFTDKSTRDKIESIHVDSRNHAVLIKNAMAKGQQKAQDEGTEYEPSTNLVQALVRNVASAQITGAMLLCIDNNVPISDVRAMLNLDALVEAEAPQEMLDDLAAIQHLDFSAEIGELVDQMDQIEETGDKKIGDDAGDETQEG